MSGAHIGVRSRRPPLEMAEASFVVLAIASGEEPHITVHRSSLFARTAAVGWSTDGTLQRAKRQPAPAA